MVYLYPVTKSYFKETVQKSVSKNMMGGHMQTMVDQNFYGLKTYTENVKDPETDFNWIAKETWDFFMRS